MSRAPAQFEDCGEHSLASYPGRTILKVRMAADAQNLRDSIDMHGGVRTIVDCCAPIATPDPEER